MQNPDSTLQRLARFAWWTALFAVAYAQSPLYTSNQNQYFLHGLAQAGFGDLNRDWLASTIDPTPIYTGLVALIWSIAPYALVFYLLYALLMGVYFFSLDVLIARLFDLAPGSTGRLVWRVLIILVHAAGWRFLVSRTLGIEWTYVLEDGLANQRMLGPVFQPSSFGVFLALALVLFYLRQPLLGVFSLVIAATFHPTYLLPAGLLTAGYLWVLGIQERRWKAALGYGALALALVLPTVWSAYLTFTGATPELAAVARRILVSYRIPHHALVAEWFNAVAVVKLAISAAALYRLRGTRLFALLLIPALGAALLTLAQVISGNLALALLFPWRVSILILPVSSAVLLGWLASWLQGWLERRSIRETRIVQLGASILLVLVVAVGGVRFRLDLQRTAQADERYVQRYVAENRQPGAIYLTPIKMQDFRLVSGVPVLVDFKSIPYHPADVLEWYHRVQQADEFYHNPTCDRLLIFRQTYSVSHVVWPAEERWLNCPGTSQTYADDAYEVYELAP